MNTDNSVDLSYTKEKPGSYYIELKFTPLSNCYQPGFKRVIKGYSDRLMKLKPADPNKGISFSYTYNYMMGDPKAKADENFSYVLPFKIG
ncbi:MAG: hypothetical protein HRT66_09450 [Flavobacteriaceae bacterium]|nr:hypothetical protein [Flavobacteriaceae bacterium]